MPAFVYDPATQTTRMATSDEIDDGQINSGHLADAQCKPMPARRADVGDEYDKHPKMLWVC